MDIGARVKIIKEGVDKMKFGQISDTVIQGKTQKYLVTIGGIQKFFNREDLVELS